MVLINKLTKLSSHMAPMPINDIFLIKQILGTQWLSGRVLELRSRSCGFQPNRCHCLVSLSNTHYFLLSTGSTQGDSSRHNSNIVDRDVKIKSNNQNQANNYNAHISSSSKFLLNVVNVVHFSKDHNIISSLICRC